MLESFANVGTLGIINLDTFKYEKGAAQALQAIGAAIWGTGAANQMLGLNAVIDDSTTVATIMGLSRATYPVLESVITAYASGKLTLATLGTQYDSAIASGMVNETPNIAYTTKAVWTFGEQLLSPAIRASYRDVGYDRVGVREKYGQRNNASLKGHSGFNSWTFREMDFIRDDFATAGVIYMANEDYIDFKGRSEVPAEYKDVIEKVDFGTMEAYEGTGAMALELPSEFNGWFYQNPLTIPDQAGRIARFYCIGNLVPRSFRRHSKGTGITGV